MLEKLENVILENVFTEEDLEGLYRHINTDAACKPIVHPEVGYTWYPCATNKEVFEKVNNLGKSLYGSEVELTEICVAKYTLNEEYMPNLTPHFDNFDGGRITIDVQLKSNTDWALYVNGERFLLQDNQALVFAGTHQAHWREEKTFEGDNFIDMLFCHFTVPGVAPLASEKIKEVESFWKKELGR